MTFFDNSRGFRPLHLTLLLSLLLSVPLSFSFSLSRQVSADPIITHYIGVVLPLTGEVSDHGNRSLIAMQLAAEEINACSTVNQNTFTSNLTSTGRIHCILPPNHKISLYPNNSQSSALVAVRHVFDQISQRNVEAVLGEYFSSISEPMAIAAASLSIPVFSSCSTSTDLSIKTTYPLFARTSPPDSEQGIALHAALAGNGWTQAQIVYSTDSYASSFQSSLLSASQSAQTNGLPFVKFVQSLQFTTGSAEKKHTIIPTHHDISYPPWQLT